MTSDLTDREKIISLANGCGIHYRPTPSGTTEMWCWDNALEAFYHAAQKEALERAALVCDEHSDDPVYCGEAIRQLIKE